MVAACGKTPPTGPAGVPANDCEVDYVTHRGDSTWTFRFYYPDTSRVCRGLDLPTGHPGPTP